MAAALQVPSTDWRITSSSGGEAVCLPTKGQAGPAFVTDAAGCLLADGQHIPKPEDVTQISFIIVSKEGGCHEQMKLMEVLSVLAWRCPLGFQRLMHGFGSIVLQIVQVLVCGGNLF
jgi:hypothetical protein